MDSERHQLHLPVPGQRIFRSMLAIWLCFLIYLLRGRVGMPFYSAIAALQCLQPKIIVCLGRIAATRLISQDFRITRQHGQWFDRNGCRCMAIYHPSALLRDVSKRPETFVDLKELAAEIRRQRIFPEEGA